MVEYSISNAKYTYMHDQTSQAIDVHHIVVRHSGSNHLIGVLSAFLLSANVFFCMFLVKYGLGGLRCGFGGLRVDEAHKRAALRGGRYEARCTSRRGMSLGVPRPRFFTTLEVSAAPLLLTFLLGAILIKSLKSVDKESVVVLPDFGVQLETHYRSGKITRLFIPIGKILKPVLNECVTPVTCYWSLSLMVRDEEELMLVFKELRPPVKMLVPVWKALCAASNGVGSPDVPLDQR